MDQLEDVVEFTTAYNIYNTSYGDKAWAISYEAAHWLARFCSEQSFDLVYDLGSGFTSWVLRRYNAGAAVISVDTSDYYRGVTSGFLERMGQTRIDCQLMHWDDFDQNEKRKADLVVYDIKGDVRAERLPIAVSLVKDNGVFFADDANRREYTAVSCKVCTEQGLVLCTELTGLTDGYGRFPAVFHTNEWSFGE